jgi:hypothetical protein
MSIALPDPLQKATPVQKFKPNVISAFNIIGTIEVYERARKRHLKEAAESTDPIEGIRLNRIAERFYARIQVETFRGLFFKALAEDGDWETPLGEAQAWAKKELAMRSTRPLVPDPEWWVMVKAKVEAKAE